MLVREMNAIADGLAETRMRAEKRNDSLSFHQVVIINTGIKTVADKLAAITPKFNMIRFLLRAGYIAPVI